MGNKVTFDYSKVSGFVKDTEVESMKKIVAAAKEELVSRSGAGNDFLGWIDLPTDYDKEEFARIKKAAEKILSGQFAINPYTENGRSIAPYVQQYQSITGFEANYHLGQARLLNKVAKSNDKEAWFNKIREELE